jgi:hypothetical protein
MSQTTEQVKEQVTEDRVDGPSQESITPVFEEVKGMDPGTAVNVLIQAAQLAQSSGSLTVRDSVMLAAAISVLRPGTV